MPNDRAKRNGRMRGGAAIISTQARNCARQHPPAEPTTIPGRKLFWNLRGPIVAITAAPPPVNLRDIVFDGTMGERNAVRWLLR
jgi:hypothetical protein